MRYMKSLGLRQYWRLIARPALWRWLLLLFFSLPIVKHILMRRVDKAAKMAGQTLFIQRIKFARRFTPMNLKTAKMWVERHF